jgi:replicative DNA helicase
MASKTKPVPVDVESERAVIAACLCDPRSKPEVAAIITPTDFFDERMRLIYSAMQANYEARRGDDVISLHSELKRRGQVEAIGGLATLSQLFHDSPSPHMAVAYAQRVRDTSVKRALIKAGGYIAALGFEDEQDAGELLGQAQGELHAVVTRTAGAAWQDTRALVRAFDARTDLLSEPGGTFVIGTGLQELDDIIGGLMAPDLVIIAARPSMGKTALALSIARHVCEPVARRGLGKRAAFFSLEMSAEEIGDRIISNVAGLDLEFVRTRRLSEDEWGAVAEAQGQVGDWGLHVDDSGRVSIDELRNRALALYAETPFDLLVLDYLQLVTGKRDRSSNREQEIASVSRELKALAKELRVPVLALAQLNREVEARAVKVPQLSDLRESGSLEQDANIVVFLHRPAVYDPNKPDTTAQLIVAKNRNGKTGSCEVAWQGAYQRFGNLDTWHSRRAA